MLITLNSEKEKPLLIVLAGPTAVGKTKLSIELAKNKNSSIFSCDSRQFYREMSIGTAKPSLDELNEVPHYFINNKSIEEAYSAGDYEKEIISHLEDYFTKQKIAFLVVFSIIFYIFDPGILIFIFQRSILLQQEILEARFWAPNSTFHFRFFRAFDHKFERSTGNSNVRPETL